MVQLRDKYVQILSLEDNLATAEFNHDLVRLNFDEASAVHSKMPNGGRANSAEKDQYELQRQICEGLRQQRDAWWKTVEARRSEQAPAGLKAQLVQNFTARQLEFRKAAGDLMPLLEKAREEHRRLEHDPVVTDALDAIRRSTKAAADLSPVKNLQNAIDTIKKAGRAFALPTNTTKKKGKATSAKSGKK